MINLRPEICYKIRDARREAGLSQSVLARELGCKQSAISMFEQGDGTKLNDEIINKLAQKFGVKLEESVIGEGNTEWSRVRTGEGGFGGLKDLASRKEWGYCPNPECPSNHRYAVGEKMYLRPQREEADPVGGKYCAMCGEILEKKCPNCGAAVHDGAVCSYCGEPYVALA